MQNNLDIILQQISKGQILTTEQVDKFLTLVLTSLSAQKKELDKENTERLFEFKEVMKYIEKEHKDVLKDWEDKLDTKTTEVYNKIKAGFNTEITKAKEIIQELRAIKLRDGVDGKDGEPGKDADEAKIVAKVLKKLPKSKDYSAVGIKDMLESLEDDDRLDYGVLKNIPDLSQLANPIMAGAGGRLLSQMNDVDISGVTDNSVLIWDEERSIWKIGTTSAGSGTVTSVSVVTANGISGTVANPTTTPAITLDISGLDATKIADGSISNTEFQYLNGVSSNIQTQLDGKVDENAAITGATKTKITYDAKGLVTGGADATTADIADTTNKRYVTDAQLTVIGNTSGTNTGDQTTIVGITGTKAQFDTAVTDGNFLYVGDITQYTDELAQDAVGGMVDSSLVYSDATPSLSRAALTGDVTASAGSNTTAIKNDVALGGSPTTTTQSAGDNTTKIATTAFVTTAVANGTVGLLDYRGSYDASTNLFPATGGSGLAGAILKGDFYICSVGGTLGGTAVTPGDLIIAIVDTPGQTSGNWDLIEHNLGAYVSDVTGTTNRITSSGGATPSIDISSTFEALLGKVANPLSQFAASTSAAIGVGTVELGHASDTTLSRSAAGQLAVEGVDVLTTSNTKTVTNKTLTTPTINGATITGDFKTDGLPDTDDTWTGKSTNSFNAGGTIAQFDCVYMTSSSTWALTDADAIGTGGNTLVMMAGEAGTNGNPLRVIEPGSWVRNDAWNWTIGGVLYLDTATPGGLTQTAPSGEDDAVKIVGHAVTADVIYFAPSVNWIIYKS